MRARDSGRCYSSDMEIEATITTDPHLLELAQQLVLRHPDLDVLKAEFAGLYTPLSVALEKVFKMYDAMGRLVLPNLAVDGNETIGIFSDYSGESDASYYTYSFLLCAYNRTALFQEKMKALREKFALGNKEIEFKDFRMAKLRKALPEYLRYLDNFVPGLLFTLVIGKSLPTVFGTPTQETRNAAANSVAAGGYGARTPADAEKLLRIVHTAAFLVGLLGHEKQKIFWM